MKRVEFWQECVIASLRAGRTAVIAVKEADVVFAAGEERAATEDWKPVNKTRTLSDTEKTSTEMFP